jgi:hypothetical protein
MTDLIELSTQASVEVLLDTAQRAGWSRAEVQRAIRREDLPAPGVGADG